MNEFVIKTESFTGPIDLLVQLVRQHELDLQEIAISAVVSQFLDFLPVGADPEMMDAIGDFIVAASQLVEFKSRLIVPRTENAAVAEDEEPIRQELVKQLLEYRRFKEAAALLWERACVQQMKLPRLATDEPTDSPDEPQPIRELELWDLVSAFGRLMRENIVPMGESVERDPTPIGEYMNMLEAIVLAKGSVTFRDLIGLRNSRVQLIGKFLALLELIKSQRVWVEVQEDDRNEILVVAPNRRPELPPKEEETPDVLEDSSVPPDQNVEIPVQTVPTRKRRKVAVEPGEKVDAIGGETASSSGVGKAAKKKSAWDDFVPILGSSDPPPTQERGPEEPAGGTESE